MSEEPIRLRGGFETRDRRLDRVPYHDPRNRDYQLRPVLDVLAGQADPEELERAEPDDDVVRFVEVVRAPRSPARRPAKPTLDQGSEGACVGFSIGTLMNASPIRRQPPWTAAEARWLYRSAQHHDEWPGEDYEGTSIVAALRVAQEHRLIGEYRWLGAGSGQLADDVVDCLEQVGGFVAGIPVYGSMFDPDEHGVMEVDPTSGLYGYHAVAVLDYRDRPLPGRGRADVPHVVMQNTWGSSWGGKWYRVGGHAYVRLDDLLAHLLPAEVWGEAVTFVEIEHGPGSPGYRG